MKIMGIHGTLYLAAKRAKVGHDLTNVLFIATVLIVVCTEAVDTNMYRAILPPAMHVPE